VRPPAQVDEVTLPVERDAVVADALEDLHLERLAALAEVCDGVGARHLLALERQVGLGDRPHRVLDAHEIVRREGLGLGEVVVEAVLDGGPDRHAHVGEELLHGLRHHVGRGVPEGGQRLGRAVEVTRQDEVTVFFGLSHQIPIAVLLTIMGAPIWPPCPPTLVTPRQSRGAPRLPETKKHHRAGTR
jgi:hypothetical protein